MDGDNDKSQYDEQLTAAPKSVLPLYIEGAGDS